ncbi:unnamed protein product [Linum trigynum]|uniref:Uncharacterized protein n=1 Tax=Linum trigynum TaxID=586398 RepID=A0AAV2EUZ6_9ROSI
MSAGGVVYQEVVINDDDADTMMLQFLSDNGMRLAEVYVETEAVGETHSHQYSYDDGFAGGCGWGGSSSNYEGGSYTGGYGEGGVQATTVEEVVQDGCHQKNTRNGNILLMAFNGLLGVQSGLKSRIPFNHGVLHMSEKTMLVMVVMLILLARAIHSTRATMILRKI